MLEGSVCWRQGKGAGTDDALLAVVAYAGAMARADGEMEQVGLLRLVHADGEGSRWVDSSAVGEERDGGKLW